VLPPVLIGPRATLRPVVEADRAARQAYGWHADIERGFGELRADGPMSDDEAEEWYAESVRMRDDPTCVAWVVDVDGALVGETFLHTLRPKDAKARYAVGLFSPEHLGRGWGAEITALVLDHAVDDLGLHRVDLRVLAFNERAIACYRRCGFVVEGRERDSCRIGDTRYDDVIMSVLAEEHRARRTQPASEV